MYSSLTQRWMKKPVTKFKHSREEWGENITLAQKGCKRSIDWIYINIYPMFKKIAKDEDIVQELMLHFHAKVLPVLDTKYIPMSIIYKSAKRIMININKKSNRTSEKDDIAVKNNSENTELGIPESMLDVSSAEDKFNEPYEVILCCMGDFSLLRLLDDNVTKNDVKSIYRNASSGLFSRDWS